MAPPVTRGRFGETRFKPGALSPSTSFALAAGNTNAQGIADPPVARPLAVAAPRPAVKSVQATDRDALLVAEPDQDRALSSDSSTSGGPLVLRSRRRR